MLFTLGWLAAAQQPDAATLARDVEHLSVLGSVLYVAAHPDDENTRLLAMLAGERGYDVTYLSLTRGGGGQNLVGTQMSELLGVVRTGELLAARSIDGADQRFTRARDFGYSKSAEEALQTWGHDEVLNDVVRVIREVRPDVVITRFGPNDHTHGHHVASAVLAAEATIRAADPTYQTAGQVPWIVDRVVRNQSHWRIDENTDTSGWITLDVGGYDAARGLSWGEVAAASRTMHKSQGFGSAPTVGPTLEYFSPVAGNVPAVGADLFAGLDTTWNRVPGARRVSRSLARVVVDPLAPADALPALARVHTALGELPDTPWVIRKRADVERLLVELAGLHVRARAHQPSVAPGGTVPVDVDITSRAVAVELNEARLLGHTFAGGPLAPNEPKHFSTDLAVPDTLPLTRPHWLAEPPTAARYTLAEGPQRTAPDTAPSVQIALDLTIAGVALTVHRPVQYGWTDRVHGELTHDLEVLPAATVTLRPRRRLVAADSTVEVPIELHASGPATTVVATLANTPHTLRAELGPDRPREDLVRDIPVGREPLTLTPEHEGTPHWASDRITLPHLPHRTVLRPGSIELVPVGFDRGDVHRIAYLMGSGDEIPRTLTDLGYDVTVFTRPDVATLSALDTFDTVVLGIRALNTSPFLASRTDLLHAYVERGGRLIVQYNTSTSRRPLEGVGPAPLVIRRGRVTDETAPLVPIDPDHPVLTTPNLLTDADFEGWVQERGLYFAESWDPVYRPVFRTNDPGEAPLEGSLLIAPHGDGVFVYTGISFFRQLPAGVPGAARLLANLLAVEPIP